jgi:hypothetical protein
MTYGASLLVIAVGAILKYAVTADLSGIDIHTVGLILMIAGGMALAIALFVMFRTRPSGRRDPALDPTEAP